VKEAVFLGCDAAENLGFRSLGVQIDFKTLVEEVPFPCIVHWNKNHFVVVYKIDKNNKVYISDPSYGLITYTGRIHQILDR
jgi:ATP-binding cassette subfamily B protein